MKKLILMFMLCLSVFAVDYSALPENNKVIMEMTDPVSGGDYYIIQNNENVSSMTIIDLMGCTSKVIDDNYQQFVQSALNTGWTIVEKNEQDNLTFMYREDNASYLCIVKLDDPNLAYVGTFMGLTNDWEEAIEEIAVNMTTATEFLRGKL